MTVPNESSPEVEAVEDLLTVDAASTSSSATQTLRSEADTYGLDESIVAITMAGTDVEASNTRRLGSRSPASLSTTARFIYAVSAHFALDLTSLNSSAIRARTVIRRGRGNAPYAGVISGQGNRNASACENCPPYTFTASDGSFSEDNCKCLFGIENPSTDPNDFTASAQPARGKTMMSLRCSCHFQL